MVRRYKLFMVTCVCLILGMSGLPAWGQKKSVKPGINDKFLDPNVSEWVERFEREGRDVYDKREEIVGACQIRAGMFVADVGAGSGLFTRLFSPAVGPNGKVFAVDISEKFIDSIRKACQDEGKDNVVGVVCTAEDCKLPVGEIDVVFICDTYHHFEYPGKTLAGIRRALKPNGRLFLIDFVRIEGKSSKWLLNHVRAGQEVFAKEIVTAGFRSVRKIPLSDEKYFLEFARTSLTGE